MKARYRKRPDQYVVAVQLKLETEGFTYKKWGARQVCKRGDWLVDNNGEIYTVDRKTFATTYKKVGKGQFVKTTPVLAEVAKKDGTVRTKEGSTDYAEGDYIVYNDEEGEDRYAVSKATFEAQYELVDEEK